VNPQPSGAVLEDRYVIDKLIVQGGFAMVYLAHDRQMGGAAVAIKQFNTDGIPPADLAGCKQQFMQEALILRGLHHPRIPRVYGCFEHLSMHFLVMDYIQGASLDTVAGPALPLSQALTYASQIAETLAYLHAQQPQPVIHKDLNPHNVMLTAQGCVLLDFGISKVASDGIYATRTAVRGFGTPGYASPEMRAGKGAEPGSDLYALGATLYYLLTGSTPADALERQQEVFKANSDPLVPVEAVRSDVPAPVAAILARLLVLQRTRRFASAAEVLAVLRVMVPGATSAPVPGGALVAASSMADLASSHPAQASPVEARATGLGAEGHGVSSLGG
jgi:eukaryotic-like serine/threonine-protein kinase